MTEKIRLKTVLTKFNISLQRVVNFLHNKGIEIENNPNVKIDNTIHKLLIEEFKLYKQIRDASEKVSLEKKKEKEKIREEFLQFKIKDKTKNSFLSEVISAKAEKLSGPKTIGKINLEKINYKNSFKEKKFFKKNVNPTTSHRIIKQNEINKSHIKGETLPQLSSIKSLKTKIVEKNPEHIKTQYQKLSGLIITGDKIDLSQFEKKKSTSFFEDQKKKRKRIKKEIIIDEVKIISSPLNSDINKKNINQKSIKIEKSSKKTKKKTSNIILTDDQINKQIKETLEKLSLKGGKSKTSKFRREKRQFRKEKIALQANIDQKQDKVIKIAEFATVNELSSMMQISENKVILTCMSLGIMVTMNQRLDAETITLVADEFGYNIKFIGIDLQEAIKEEKDSEKDLKPRPPVVTIMGHVDHGKTSLLDYIRNTKVISMEYGGITQHIGAYSVTLNNGRNITFLDTPGHEAFTAMRARGAQITDIAIIVIDTNDQVMPQTKEAISHAQIAGIPMIFALNKIDKPTAQPEKIREQLSRINLLVEEWGGKYQSQEISTKTGIGIDKLLEKILLESDLLELKANPKKLALGVVIEATLDKGRGYVTTMLIQGGTLKIGDYVLAGIYHGKVKVILDEFGKNITQVGPSFPITILGLNGAPSAGDKFKVFKDEKEAKWLASRREQLQREQNIRSQKHLTLDEIGRRIALGDFKELKIIIKGDVDGSVEALSDSLQKLSTNIILINIIYKGVGQINESDVLLASASDAIIIGFNVRPANNAKNIAEKEDIEIRLYSIIYNVINDIKEAIDGLLSPEIREQILGVAEVRELFQVTKIGIIAGCMITEGKLIRHSKIRLIRQGIVIYHGELKSLKHHKDDSKELSKGYECGIGIKDYNNIQIGDIIEAYEEITMK